VVQKFATSSVASCRVADPRLRAAGCARFGLVAIQIVVVWAWALNGAARPRGRRGEIHRLERAFSSPFARGSRPSAELPGILLTAS